MKFEMDRKIESDLWSSQRYQGNLKCTRTFWKVRCVTDRVVSKHGCAFKGLPSFWQRAITEGYRSGCISHITTYNKDYIGGAAFNVFVVEIKGYGLSTSHCSEQNGQWLNLAKKRVAEFEF
ncbi:hypothetical protein ACTXT7_008337 [Hymenolepis weldensis]